MKQNHMKNFLVLHFHQFSWESVNFLELDLDLPLDFRNFFINSANVFFLGEHE